MSKGSTLSSFLATPTIPRLGQCSSDLLQYHVRINSSRTARAWSAMVTCLGCHCAGPIPICYHHASDQIIWRSQRFHLQHCLPNAIPPYPIALHDVPMTSPIRSSMSTRMWLRITDRPMLLGVYESRLFLDIILPGPALLELLLTHIILIPLEAVTGVFTLEFFPLCK